jgi:hypothetical protein
VSYHVRMTQIPTEIKGFKTISDQTFIELLLLQLRDVTNVMMKQTGCSYEHVIAAMVEERKENLIKRQLLGEVISSNEFPLEDNAPTYIEKGFMDVGNFNSKIMNGKMLGLVRVRPTPIEEILNTCSTSCNDDIEINSKFFHPIPSGDVFEFDTKIIDENLEFSRKRREESIQRMAKMFNLTPKEEILKTPPIPSRDVFEFDTKIIDENIEFSRKKRNTEDGKICPCCSKRCLLDYDGYCAMCNTMIGK